MGFGSHTFTADDAAAGTVTFTCDIEFGDHDGFVGTHCTAGQIITFNVVDAAMKAVEVATEAPQAEIDEVATEAPQTGTDGVATETEAPQAETEDSTSSEPTLASQTPAAPSSEQPAEEPSSSTNALWMVGTVLVLIGTALVVS